MPFALNEATRFISPTKTPEYLAAGKPVVSTPIRDVVRSWGHLEAVRVAGSAADFVSELEAALAMPERDPAWLIPVDAELDQVSWQRTWEQMAGLTAAALRRSQDRPRASGSSVLSRFIGNQLNRGRSSACLTGWSSGPDLPAASLPNGSQAGVTRKYC